MARSVSKGSFEQPTLFDIADIDPESDSTADITDAVSLVPDVNAGKWGVTDRSFEEVGEGPHRESPRFTGANRTGRAPRDSERSGRDVTRDFDDASRRQALENGTVLGSVPSAAYLAVRAALARKRNHARAGGDPLQERALNYGTNDSPENRAS